MTENYRHKVICDPVHNEIGVSALEQQLIDAASFQRLRKLKQLGLASLVYPSASHTRFAHSLGVFSIMSHMIDILVEREKFNEEDRRKMRIAALLHDIGHYPYSHLMEYVDKDKHRPNYLIKKDDSASTEEAQSNPPSRYPDHEKIGQLIITKREDIATPLTKAGLDPEEIAKIIRGQHGRVAYNQLIHSSLDMDRMDYLVRDSLGTGVPYGRIDLHYILSNLDVTDDGEVVIAHKAAAAAEHFVVARYFMYKAVYMHKTIFGFEALLRHILFLLKEHGAIYRDGAEIEKMVLTDKFLKFHDGYVDELVDKYADDTAPPDVAPLCTALAKRKPPKLVHEVAVLSDQSQDTPTNYALFVKDRANRISELETRYGIERTRWIWEDPKDIKFESLGPFISISEAVDVRPEETAELIRIKHKDGRIAPLVENPHSILHHLSKLRMRMSRLYVVGPVEDDKFAEIQQEVSSWAKED